VIGKKGDFKEGDSDMMKNIQTEIDYILKNYNQVQVHEYARIQERKKLKEQFLARFDKVKDEVIIPAMKEIAEYLDMNGQSTVIGDSTQNRIVFMNIFPGKIQTHSHPSISFSVSESTQMVSIHTKSFMPNSEGLEKYLDDYTLSTITKDFVEKQILNLVRESFVAKPRYLPEERFGSTNSSNVDKFVFWAR